MGYLDTSTNKNLKANRAMLGKRKKEKFSFATSKDETKQFTKEATPEQLQEIRDRIQKEKKQEQKKFVFITILALIIIYLFATLIDWHWLFKNFKN